jgi:sec-independent protein translocase protein TatB
MFNIGGGEFLVIALIALIVLGPQRLPDAARQLGKVMGELRRVSNGFQAELKGALDEADPQGPPTPRRDVLGATKATEAAPPSTTSSPTPSPARPARRAPLKAAPVPKAARPRSKGS